MDGPICYDKGLEVLLLDVKRAYDSVSWTSLERSLQWIRVPVAYIRLLRTTFAGRTAEVMTGYGNTAQHHPECSLDQEEVNSPLLWPTFYDPLLTRLRASQYGYAMGNGRQEGPPVAVALSWTPWRRDDILDRIAIRTCWRRWR